MDTQKVPEWKGKYLQSNTWYIEWNSYINKKNHEKIKAISRSKGEYMDELDERGAGKLDQKKPWLRPLSLKKVVLSPAVLHQ